MSPRPAALLFALFLPCALIAASDSPSPTHFKFDFGSATPAPGFIKITPDWIYSTERGYGFEPGSAVVAVDRGGADPLTADFVTAEKPFYFSVKVPEGNYRVTITLGDLKGEPTTVKSELRRLMLHNRQTARKLTCEFETAELAEWKQYLGIINLNLSP